jgi:hypothetical protein
MSLLPLLASHWRIGCASQQIDCAACAQVVCAAAILKMKIEGIINVDQFVWCRDHRCYHQRGDLPFTEQAVIALIYRSRKLTTRQAKRYGLAIDGNIMFLPTRNDHGEWETFRYRWRIDGQTLQLEPPDWASQPSRN